MLGMLYLYLEIKNQLAHQFFLNKVLFSLHVQRILCPIKLTLEISSSVSTSEFGLYGMFHNRKLLVL